MNRAMGPTTPILVFRDEDELAYWLESNVRGQQFLDRITPSPGRMAVVERSSELTDRMDRRQDEQWQDYIYSLLPFWASDLYEDARRQRRDD